MEPRPELTFHNTPQQAGTSQPGDVNATDAEVTMLVETAEWTINRARRSRGLGEPPDGEAAEPRIREFPTGAVRDSDADATRYDLISPQAMERLAATYAEGAAKYSDHNFRKGIPYSVMANHALRHIYRWLAGEDGEDHLAHAACGLFGLIEFEETRPELDDRSRWEDKT